MRCFSRMLISRSVTVAGVIVTARGRPIRIDLCGIAVVRWNSSEEGNNDLDPDEVRRDNKEQYFLKKITLLEKEGSFVDKDPVLTAGEYTFDFECKLPQELPSSFEGRHGQVRYLARACIERNWKSNVVTKKAFTILNGLDLNFIPEAASRIEICKYKTVGTCCISGSVTIDWMVERSGYVPGESIIVHGEVQNECRSPVVYCKTILYMIIDYKSTKRRKRERREIAVAKQDETPPGEVSVWHDRLHIPPLPPTGISRSKLIDINYELQFTALIEGAPGPIVYTKDIYIGTVPMCQREMRSCIAGMYNQPYTPSVENLDHFSGVSASQVSLTQIVATGCAIEPKTRPTAPSLATLERGLDSVVMTDPDPSVNHRPPPFAPGHGDVFMSPVGDVTSPHEGPSVSPTPATDPSTDLGSNAQSQCDATDEDPTYESGMFEPVSIREVADDAESLRGEFTYAPVYPYFNTVHRP
ncbi:hypothetical protein NP493_492g01039 [Ridgeia piscesae]|uniref:Arrestin C-terminal-like domain-containing protein n=1 Tax=Ridgeia piscesae TaxID=27915 RepID=A0AAD9NSX1_RIDPI|nr:hypothetical protein NP493_492g01039 [Ridgeia piscesae]